MEKDIFQGCRIILTREPEDNAPLRDVLERRGAEVIEIPSIAAFPLEPANAEEVLSIWNKINWTAFTSRKAVKFFAEWISARGLGFPPASMFAAVGRGTAQALLTAGARADLVPGTEDGFHLGKELSSASRAATVLFPQAASASGSAQDILRNAGWKVVEMKLYETRAVKPASEAMAEMKKGAALIFFASPSAVSSFFSSASSLSIPEGVGILPIGKTTFEKAFDLGLKPLAPPADTGIPAIIESMERFLRKSAP